ncbi:hypothetical protein [Pseudorhizobium flavum]|uniref:hypothetical protein n=1 Tax=Pseudorhizobium flavum TaxID=1335061 RepID=UPI00376FB8D6
MRIVSLLVVSLSIWTPCFGQDIPPLSLGGGAGQLGLIDPPNEECKGPVTVAAAPDNGIAILDEVNHKILVVAAGKDAVDINLPPNLIEPVDLLGTTKGYIVAGMLGQVVLLSAGGEPLATAATAYDPERGQPRIVVSPTNEILLENLEGIRVAVELDRDQVGEVIEPPRVCRRPQLVRSRVYDKQNDEQIFS